MRHALHALGLSAVALLASACGGGSSSKPLTPTQQMNGRYFLASLAPDLGALYATQAAVTALGDGTATSNMPWLVGEGFSSESYGDPIDLPYTVEDDLRLVLGGVPGQMSSGGHAFTLSAPPTATSTSTAALGIRTQQLSSLEPLIGSWRSVSFRRGTGDDPHMVATTGEADIFGDASRIDMWDSQNILNEDGVIRTPVALIPTERIDMGGTTSFRVTSTSRGEFFGALSQDGDVIIMWGRRDEPRYAEIRVMVREGSIGQLSGTYSVTGVRSARDDLNLRTQGTLTMSSASTGQLQESGIDATGRASASAARSGSDLDLTFAGETAGSQTVRGFVNRAGTFGVFCGPITAGDRPHIRFLVR